MGERFQLLELTQAINNPTLLEHPVVKYLIFPRSVDQSPPQQYPIPLSTEGNRAASAWVK